MLVLYLSLCIRGYTALGVCCPGATPQLDALKEEEIDCRRLECAKKGQGAGLGISS